MSFLIESKVLGKEPLVACGLVMDYCNLVEGVGACTSTESGDAKCFNTRISCNDPTNYDKGSIEVKFSFPSSALPKGENLFPMLKGKLKKSATSTTGGAGLGKREVVRISVKDFPHHDIGLDKSVSTRTYNPMELGTFWGKFIARNPYYEGRTLKLYYGYITAPFSWSNFEVHEYDLIDITGGQGSDVELVGKDVLVRTYDRKAVYPVASEGTLSADISDAVMSATLLPSGIGNSDYPASGTLSIGKEAIAYTRSGDALTFTERETWGTTAKKHKAGNTVQICPEWDGTVNIIDFLQELLETGAGLPSSFIPYATNWTDEKAIWLINSTVKGVLLKPESIEKIIGEVSESFMFDIWWNSLLQEVRIKALSPEIVGATLTELTEGASIVKGSVKIERKSKLRYTSVNVHYNKVDYSEKDSIDNFANLKVAADVSLSDVDHHNGTSIKTIYSRWFDTPALAIQLAGRYLARFSETPEIVSFNVDIKDKAGVVMAERVRLNTWQLQGLTGANENKNYQVTEIGDGDDIGHDFKVKAITSSFNARYFFITPASHPDYSASTDEEKETYGYISDASGKYPSDNTNGAKLI